jgi:hypothetical protein
MSDKYPGGFVTAGAPAGFSVAFDGTGDYLSMSSGTSLGAGNFTIECWVYLTAAPAGETTVGSSSDYYTAGFNGNFVFRVGTTNLWRSFDAQSNQATIDGTFTWSTGQWYHMAWVRNSGTVTVYRNGTSLGSVADSKTLSDSTNGYAVAATKSGGSYSSLLTGYISNLRVVVGTALYTTTFTPPTQLLNISGTSLLTCNSPTIIDQSTNAYAITVSGDSKVSNFTPFAGYTGFNPALGAAAGGVWTLDEAAYYQQNRLWPIYDPYFNQTTLMLHGNQPSGVTDTNNNVFKDSSTNNFTITRNGNTTQGSFTPFSQTGWSNFFDGTDDRLATPSNAAFTLGTGDYTYECWVYHTDLSNQQTYFARGTAGDVNGVYFYKANTTNLIGVYYTSQIVTSNTAVGANQWLHLAACRASGTTRLFINGVQVGSSADTTNLTESIVHVGADANGTNGVKGYMSNARVIKGVALYTSNFTPSNSPLTAVTGTTLLTCQDNRFVDDSANNFALTVGGTPSVQAFSPFVPAYITPTTYSNWFDGTGDSLNLGGQAAFAFGTGDFTIENWIYISSGSGAERVVIDFRPNTTNGAYPMVMVTTGNILAYYVNTAIQITGTTTVALNTWHHIALARSGSSTKLFLNGIQEGSTYTDTVTYLVGTDRPIIGSSGFSGANYFFGTMSNLRVLKGTALYTAAFTPPTAPLTNITNTSLLTCQSSTFIDNSTNNFTITANGNVQPVTSPTPFPAKVDTTTLNSAYSTSLIGGSGYFDGSGDSLSVPDSATLKPGTGDFTWEAWLYPTAAGGNHFIFSQSGSSLDIYRNGSNKLVIDQAGVVNLATSTNNIPLNAWTHYAFTRSGTTTRLFVNGALDVSGTSSANLTNSNATSIGLSWPGYISSHRFVKGTAVYTANFAPPLLPLTAITNTSLLLSATNGAIFDNTAKNVLETVGSAAISTTQSKYGGSSMYFAGSPNYLQLSNPNANVQLGSGNFTIEMWVNFNSAAGTQILNNYGYEGGSTNYSYLFYYSSSTIRFANSTDGSAGTSQDNSLGAFTPTVGTWYHLALVRNGATVTCYADGTALSAPYNIAARTIFFPGNASTFTLGANAGNYFSGYIDDFRITKGVARYTTNFTPPTSQLQDQ